MNLEGLAHLSERFEALPGRRLTVVDSHTAGEGTRLVVGGVDPLPGGTMVARLEHFRRHFDDVRLALTREPRGHRDLLAAVVTRPVSDDASFGLLYMDARRYPWLCGHATMGAVTSLVELGAIALDDGEHTVVVDTPSGPVTTRVEVDQGRALCVTVEMVPSFVHATAVPLALGELGVVDVDVVYVGGFFVMIDAAVIGVDLDEGGQARHLIDIGMQAIDAANAQLTVSHPQRPEVDTIDVAEIYRSRGVAGRSAVVYGERHLDRSPCGTGTTAKMTLLHHRGELRVGETYDNRGCLGTAFAGRVLAETSVGGWPAVRCEVRGAAHITGLSRFVVRPSDPLPDGFLL